MSPTASEFVWEPPALAQLLRWALPGQKNTLDAWIVRALALLARQQVVAVAGLEHVRAAHDPFILAINHSTRTESLLVPALLVLHRGGRLIHFFADWNYRLIPGIGLIYRRAQTITVTRKSAKPAFLNVLKPFYAAPPTALERARRHLANGHSIGIFPEGTVNRDPQWLLPGRRGAAYLSLATRAPIVPVGIRFPGAAGRIGDRAHMEVTIGAPMMPPRIHCRRPSFEELRRWHGAVMGEIGRLSGKHHSSLACELRPPVSEAELE
jgi:1-acyl-sn-glycerol-3-phosphate acyltransferase